MCPFGFGRCLKCHANRQPLVFGFCARCRLLAEHERDKLEEFMA